MDFASSALRLIGSYLVGLLAGGPATFLLFMVLQGLFGDNGQLTAGAVGLGLVGSLVMGLVFGIAAVMIAWPFLLFALAVLALFGSHIRGHLVGWCSAAPFAVAASWLAVEYGGDYARRGFDLGSYLTMRAVWERAALAFVSSAIVAVLFHRWQPDSPREV